MEERKPYRYRGDRRDRYVGAGGPGVNSRPIVKDMQAYRGVRTGRGVIWVGEDRETVVCFGTYNTWNRRNGGRY